MQTRRHILLDCLVYFIIYGYFLAVYDFLYALSVSILAGNFSLYGYFLIVVFLFYSQSDELLCPFTDLFCSCLCCNDLSVIDQLCYLISQ